MGKCEQKCLYTLKDLELRDSLTVSHIKDELKRHGHPKSRIMDIVTKRQRNTDEGARELIAHYKHCHNLKF